MANKIKFITGENYNLSELFSGQRSIIIPDLQRDYCWGNNDILKLNGQKGNLVADFVEGLIEQFEQNPHETLNLGLVYGYEVPADHIQICDGQQRLTTLFLLLGMLNKKTNLFRQQLISDYEYKHDDKEPYLSYAIRESSLYFLSDLVCNFFTDKDSKVEDIKSEPWYFADYDLDPSITSMLSALKTIETILNKEPKEDVIEMEKTEERKETEDKKEKRDFEWFQAFGTWLLQKVTFLYFDMESRKNGEETFVVINTTGEPLSAAQNLKPLVISSEINSSVPNSDQMWEEMETWFWQKRQGDNDTSDAGFAEFLRWVHMIEKVEDPVPEKDRTSEIKNLIQLILQGKWQTVFPYKEIGIEKLYKYWQSLKFLTDNSSKGGWKVKKEWLSPAENNNVQGLNAISQNDCFVLLPMLKFAYGNYENLGKDSQRESEIILNLRRLYEFLRNIMRLDNASKAVNTLVKDAIKIVELIKAGDILEILEESNLEKISSQILTSEEKMKLRLLKASCNREQLEQIFWKAQSSPVWNGRIKPVLYFAMATVNQKPDESAFDEYLFQDYESLLDDKLLTGPFEHEKKANRLRRCLIVASEQYEPLQRSSYYTFGWKWEDWYNLLSRKENRDNIKEFLNYILANKNYKSSNVEEALKDYISENIDLRKNYAEFAQDNYLLSFTSSSSACDLTYSYKDWQICTSGGTGRHTSFFSLRNARILKELGGKSKNRNPDEGKILDENKNWFVWYWSASDWDNCVVIQSSQSNIKLDVRYRCEGNKLELILKKVDKKGEKVDVETIVSKLGLFKKIEESKEEAQYTLNQDFNTRETKEIILGIVNTLDIILANIDCVRWHKRMG